MAEDELCRAAHAVQPVVMAEVTQTATAQNDKSSSAIDCACRQRVEPSNRAQGPTRSRYARHEQPGIASGNQQPEEELTEQKAERRRA